MPNKKYIIGIIYCLIATISWGAMFPVMADALKYLDPFTLTALRYTIATVAFVVLLIFIEGKHKLSLKGERFILAWFLGSAGFAGFGFLVFLGQKLAGPSGSLIASSMAATMPMLSLFVVWGLRRVRPPIFSFGFVALSFLGVLLVITHGDFSALLQVHNSFQATILLLLGVLCWVLYTVGPSYFPKWSPYRYTAITAILGLTTVIGVDVALMLLKLISVPDEAILITLAPHIFYMAIIAGFVGVLCWNLGNQIITPVNGVLFVNVIPITAFVISTISGAIPSAIQIIGVGITVIALLMNNLYQRRKNKMRNGAS